MRFLHVVPTVAEGQPKALIEINVSKIIAITSTVETPKEALIIVEEIGTIPVKMALSDIRNKIEATRSV